MTQQIVLRPTTAMDFARYAELRSGDDTSYWFYNQLKFDLSEVHDWLSDWCSSRSPDKDRMFMAEVDGRVIGICSLHGIKTQKRTAEVGRIIVDESYRGQGLDITMLQILINSQSNDFDLFHANISRGDSDMQKILEKVGFVVQKKENNKLIYLLPTSSQSDRLSN